MAEIFQNRERNIEHVGIFIAEYRMGFPSIAGALEDPIEVCSIAACGWALNAQHCIV